MVASVAGGTHSFLSDVAGTLTGDFAGGVVFCSLEVLLGNWFYDINDRLSLIVFCCYSLVDFAFGYTWFLVHSCHSQTRHSPEPRDTQTAGYERPATPAEALIQRQTETSGVTKNVRVA